MIETRIVENNKGKRIVEFFDAHQILVDVAENGNGLELSKMQLDREHAMALASLLQAFAETGRLPECKDWS